MKILQRFVLIIDRRQELTAFYSQESDSKSSSVSRFVWVLETQLWKMMEAKVDLFVPITT
jgi:hypothetical protein